MKDLLEYVKTSHRPDDAGPTEMTNAEAQRF